VVQAADHERVPCARRDPSCAQFSCVLETGTLALFVSTDCVWGAKVTRSRVVIKTSKIAADPIALHSGCASRIAADIRIAANLIVIYYGHSGIVIYSEFALDHATCSIAQLVIGT
jgi:hypothetical protein